MCTVIEAAHAQYYRFLCNTNLAWHGFSEARDLFFFRFDITVVVVVAAAVRETHMQKSISWTAFFSFFSIILSLSSFIRQYEIKMNKIDTSPVKIFVELWVFLLECSSHMLVLTHINCAIIRHYLYNDCLTSCTIHFMHFSSIYIKIFTMLPVISSFFRSELFRMCLPFFLLRLLVD